MEVKSGIYKITCLVNSKIYIGSAIDLKSRFRQHNNLLVRQRHNNSHLQNAFNLYGSDAFKYEVMEFVPDKEILLVREQFYIDGSECYKRSFGFNICIVAGSSLGIKRSDDFKKKISIANLNRSPQTKERVLAALKAANTGRIAHNRGKKSWANGNHPKGCLGKKFINRKFTPEGYAKICESNRKPRGAEYLAARSVMQSKDYVFKSPAGETVKITNLSNYCKVNGLNKSRMYQVAKGNEKQHKGWILN